MKNSFIISVGGSVQNLNYRNKWVDSVLWKKVFFFPPGYLTEMSQYNLFL